MELKITGLMKRHLLVNVAIFGLGKKAYGPRTQIRESKVLLGSYQLLGDGAHRHIKTIQHHATLRPHYIWKKKKSQFSYFLRCYLQVLYYKSVIKSLQVILQVILCFY